MSLELATVVTGTDAVVRHARARKGVVDGDLHASDLRQEFAGVSIDSRTVRRGDLFVALPGERTDGHKFIGSALASGARGCLVDGSLPGDALARDLAQAAEADGLPRYAFLVPDPLRALQRLAAHWRRRHDTRVVAVTGSIGKTTGKEIIASVVESAGPVLKSEGNFNSEIGLPLTLLQLERHHRVAVLEMGMYQIGEIAFLTRIAAPQVGVVTNVAPIHLERMGTIERIARAKSELVAGLPADGLAVLNGDDPWTRAMAVTSGIARSVLVGLRPDCDLRATGVTSHGLEGISFDLVAEGASRRVQSPIPGTHMVHAIAGAVAVARELDIDWETILEAIAKTRMDVRQRLIRQRDDLLIIDDSYNAAPPSMEAALGILADSPGRKIAVLGDMLELGSQEELAHRRVGERAAEVTDWLIVRGPRGSWIAEGALSHGLPEARVVRTDSNLDAARAVLDIVDSTRGTTHTSARTGRQRPDEEFCRWAVLVKGSRGMGMEEVVQELRAES